MPEKDNKNQIMETLRAYHNPFRLTDEELQQAEDLLTEIETGENWLESLQSLADILEVLPLEIHESQERYDAAVQRDAALQHKPIHVSAASDRGSVLDALAQELEFQRKHALYRYMNDVLQSQAKPEEQLAFLAAYKNIADNIERTSTKESVEAVLDNYSRTHGAPDLSRVSRKLVQAAEDTLLSDFRERSWTLGYSGPDTMNIARALNDFTKKTRGNPFSKSEATEYKAVKKALTNIHALDEKFQEEMGALVGLYSSDPKDRELNQLIDNVRSALNMKTAEDGFSLDRIFGDRENYNLAGIEEVLNTVSDDLYDHWRKHSSDRPKLHGREKVRFQTAERLNGTLEDILEQLKQLGNQQISLNKYTVTTNWLPEYNLLYHDAHAGLTTADFYEDSLEEWHDEKLQRNPGLNASDAPESEKEEPVASSREAERTVSQVQPAEKPVIRSTSGKEFYEGYGAFIVKYGEDGRKKINSNSVDELLQLYNSNDLDADGKDYLAHRMTELKTIHDLEAESVPGKAPHVEAAKDGSIVLPAVQSATQNSDRGCWSVSLATQLQYRGVALDQKTIRAFRPDTEFFDERDVAFANSDEANYLENYTELVQDVLPDTAVNCFAFDASEKAEDAEKYLRACVDRALVKDNAPLSIVFNGHYRTIYGIQKDPNGDAEKDVLLFHDPSDSDIHRVTVKEFVDLCDRHIAARSENYQTDPDYKPAYQFSVSWLQDLHMNEKGELGGELQNLGISYENGKLNCAKPEVMRMSGDKLQTICSGKLVPGMENDIHTFLPTKSYALLKAEREKAQQAEAEKLAAEQKAAAQKAAEQQKQQEAAAAQKAKEVEQQKAKAVEQPKEKAAAENRAEDISTDSKPKEKKNADASLSDADRRGKEVAEAYMWKLAQTSELLQKYMDVLVETNSASDWKKSSESYRTFYNTLRSMKGDENRFFDALRKETPRKVREMLFNLGEVRDDYMRESHRLMKKNPLREQNRVAAANKILECLYSMEDACMNTFAQCKNIDMPEYINTRMEEERAKVKAREEAQKAAEAKEKRPFKLTAKELESKMASNIKETQVGAWTSIDVVRENKKSAGVKKESKAKNPVRKK